MQDQRPIAHLDFLDGLRAVAVLSVLACHLHAALLPGGFAGVDVFFVISGFIVSASVSHLAAPGLREFLGFFYARRIARIVPALLVFLVPTFLLSAMLIPPGWLSQNYEVPGLFAFFGLSNFILADAGSDYFSPTADFNPFTHTWSLGVEEQFYLVFPLLFIAWLSPRRRTLSMVVVAVVSAASLGWAVLHTGQPSAYYPPWGRMWEIGLGVLTFQVCALAPRPRPDAASPSIVATLILPAAGSALLAWGLWTARADAAPFPAVLAPVLGTAILLATLYRHPRGPANWFLTLRPLRFLGRISYSLYLWHWGVLVLFRWTRGLATVTDMVLAVALSLALATGSWFFVEERFRRTARSAPRWATVATGFAAIALAFTLAQQTVAFQDNLSLSTVVRNKTDWYPDLVYAHSDTLDCQLDLRTDSVNGGVLWLYDRAPGCRQPATFGHRLFLLGDSHAMHYRRLLSRLVLETGASVAAYNNGGCSFLSFLPVDAATQARCRGSTDAAVADILRKGGPGDIVVLSSLRTPKIMDQWAHLYLLRDAIDAMQRPDFRKVRREQESEGLDVLRAMTAKGMKIVLVAPTGLSPRVNYRCADWFNRGNPICAGGDTFARADLDALREPALESLRLLRREVDGVFVWDPFEWLCPGAMCSSTRAGKPLYFDSDHLTAYSNDLLYPSFVALLGRIVGPAAPGDGQAAPARATP